MKTGAKIYSPFALLIGILSMLLGDGGDGKEVSAKIQESERRNESMG